MKLNLKIKLFFVISVFCGVSVYGGTSVFAETSDLAAETQRDPDFFSAEPKFEILERGMQESENRDEPLSEFEALQTYERPFQMQEYRTNYMIAGRPDTKVQFSFKFKTLKNYNLYLAYTQMMFWDLGQKDSNPFSDVNYNPELFYKFRYDYPIFFNEVDLGYSHMSNGLDGDDSRSIDEVFVQMMKESEMGFGFSKMQLRLRYIFESKTNNVDVHDYYGPVVLKLFFTNLGQRLFFSEQFYVEFYNGGKWADDFSKSSVRVSFRFKPFKPDSAPKIFFQYFNGYGENLMDYNQRDESFRLGLSIGGE